MHMKMDAAHFVIKSRPQEAEEMLWSIYLTWIKSSHTIYHYDKITVLPPSWIELMTPDLWDQCSTTELKRLLYINIKEVINFVSRFVIKATDIVRYINPAHYFSSFWLYLKEIYLSYYITGNVINHLTFKKKS